MKVTKKLLSVLLAVMMLVSSISVCFGTISFAASGTPTDAQWNALVAALKYDSIKNATFSGSANNYTVKDPDGKVLAAVEAYFDVVNVLANKAPGCGSPNNTNTSYTTYQSGTNRTINQVNDTIKTTLSSRMGADYTTYNVATFLTSLLAGASVSSGYGNETTKGGFWNDDKTVPSSNLTAVSAINITVDEKAITEYTLDNLPDTVYADKTFTVNHTNTNYDYKYKRSSSIIGSTYTRSYKFFYNISSVTESGGAETSTAAIKAAETVFNGSSYYSAADVAAVLALSTDIATLESAKATLAAEKAKVVAAHSEAIFTHFFGTKYTTAITNIDEAIVVLGYESTVNQINDYYATDYTRMNKTETKNLLDNFKATYKTFTDLGDSAKALIISTYGLDTAAVEERIQEISDRYDALCILEYKATAELHIAEYEEWTVDDVDNGDVTAAMITAAIAALNLDIQNLEAYDADFVAAVAGEGYVDSLKALKASLAELGVVAGYNEDFLAEYAEFAADIQNITTEDYEDLYNSLNNYDKWYTDLKALIDEMRTELGDEIATKLFDDLNTLMVDHMNVAYAELNTRTEVQINVAYDLFYAYVNTYGEKVNMATVSEYRAMKNSIGLIDVDSYNFLKGTANFDISDDAVAKYDAMQKDFPQYEEFLSSHGFATFETNEIEDIVRTEEEADGHDAHIGDYTVEDEAVEEIITLLETLLADEDIKAILGDLINKDEDGNPTGEPFALGALVEGLLNDAVFTDSLLNTIVQFVYPIVCKEFAKVWAGLPSTFTALGVETGVDIAPTADVKDCPLYLNDVETAIAAVGVFLSPATLANNLQNTYGANNGEYAKYTQAISVLKSATTKAVYTLNGDGDEDDTFTNPWEDPNLFTNVYDEVTGEQQFNDDGTPKQVYKIDWGIDAAENKREAFVDAACAALSGLEPLLFAILTNHNQANDGDDTEAPRGHKIGTGKGTAQVYALGFLPLTLTLNIDPITLVLKFSGNDGWDNALAPIFEALGLENIPHGEDLTTTRKILEDGLLAMIDQLIDRLDTDPITFLLEALPNLAFALEGGLVKPLLGMLKTDISYYADAAYTGTLGDNQLAASVLKDAMASEEPIKINIGEMINLEDMGLDISSFTAIWNMLAGSVDLLANLAAPNAGYLATLGELTEKDTNRSAKTYTGGTNGKAYYIEANKADVLIYLLRYVLNALPGILDSLEDIELSDDVKAIIADVTADPDKTIAAVVELLNQVEYDTLKEYVWYASEVNEGTVVGLTPAIQKYLGYDNDWTKEKADYIIGNVDNIITAVLDMVNDGKAEDEKVNFSISETLTGLISGLFTNKNLTALAKALGGLDLNALLAGDEETEEETEAPVETLAENEEAEESALDINALVAKFAGIDLSVYARYADLAEDEVLDWGFEDGDKDGFVNALIALVEPLQSVIDFILAGSDLELLDGDVKLVGYNGYDSAIIPILEALGATPAALQDGDNVLAVVINALLGVVESLDSVDAILDLIPGVLYFIKSNGLTTAVRNLLQPVLVILETIDPIYALNLNELIGGLTKDLGFTLNLDNLSFEAIFDILPAFVDLDLTELEEIIDDVCEVITPVDYTSASSVIGENGKKGAYGEYFDEADLVTVVLSFALSWLQEEGNADAIVKLIAGDDAEKAEEIAQYINGAIVIINGIDPEYEAINWAYNFPDGFDEAIFESGIQIQPTINTITYPTNWTEETAEYVAENLDEIVDEVISGVEINGTKYESLAKLIDDKVNIYTAENVDAIVKVVADLLADIDEVLVNTVGLVLGADLETLKAYKADADIDTAEEFAAALTEALATIQPVIDWLLFGEDYAFFSKSGVDLVTIKGAEGYAYGLAPILEALGVAAPAKGEATVATVLDAVFARVDAVLADPVNEVFELLPNVIYFLNANGVSTSVKNLLAGVTALTDVISEEFGLEVDLMKIFNDLIKGLLPEDTTVTIDVANLDLESIFNLVQELLGLDLTPIADILIDLCVGQIVAYTSASGEYGFKMMYTDDFAKYDMVTIIASCLLQIIKIEENEDALKKLLGEDIYTGVLNVISLDVNVPVQEFDWALTDKADTGEVFSALQSSELYGEGQYGPLYTKEMEQYISENFGEFVDNIVYLLGIEINGESVDNLKDLLNGLVNGNLYNSANVVAIRDALAGLTDSLEGTLPAGSHILEILKLADLADLKAVAAVEVPEFTEDREQFVTYLCAVLEPLYPVLEWLLADTDITFFVDEEKNTVVTLPGAEGYAYGLIPVLEALDCDGIIAPDAYYATIEAGDEATVITAIIDPILDRLDEILANPADEILSILPNLIYFINSNGVDTVVKNTLNAVYTLLNAIESIAKIDLYELIGIDLATIDFDWLFDKLLEIIADSTGYEFSAIDANAIVELTVGTLESYTSLNGRTAYRMVYQSAEAKGEMVTVVLRLVVTFIMHENNQEALLGLLRDNGMTEETEKYVGGVLHVIAECATETYLGMDQALATIYYLFYGADIGVGETANGVKDLNAEWRAILKELGLSDNPDEASIGNLIADILDMDIFEDIIDTEGIAPNGFIAFFQKIISWFKMIIEWIKNLFA